HLGRLLPDARFFLTHGPHVGENTPIIGQYTRIVKGAPDGTLYLGRDVDDLRIITPDLRVAWTSNATRRRDERAATDLAEARRGGRLGRRPHRRRAGGGRTGRRRLGDRRRRRRRRQGADPAHARLPRAHDRRERRARRIEGLRVRQGRQPGPVQREHQQQVHA